jgi:hypothetical protein
MPSPPEPYVPDPHDSHGSPRPATIAELAERARGDFWDPSRELKYWLRIAQKYRNDGKEFVAQGALEHAFIAFARSATIVLEKLPMHRDYQVLLSEPQRTNLQLVSVVPTYPSHMHMPHTTIVLAGCRAGSLFISFLSHPLHRDPSLNPDPSHRPQNQVIPSTILSDAAFSSSSRSEKLTYLSERPRHPRQSEQA